LCVDFSLTRTMSSEFKPTKMQQDLVCPRGVLAGVRSHFNRHQPGHRSSLIAREL
jgi:hypothetical protein